MQFAWPDQLRRSRVQPICNIERNTSRTRGNDRGMSVIRTFASKNAACFFLILRTSAGWLKFFTFLEARARCNSQSVHTNFDSERSPPPYHCMGLRHSSFLFSFSDRVWLAPAPRQCLNAFRYGFLQYRHLFWPAVLMGMHFWCKA